MNIPARFCLRAAMVVALFAFFEVVPAATAADETPAAAATAETPPATAADETPAAAAADETPPAAAPVETPPATAPVETPPAAAPVETSPAAPANENIGQQVATLSVPFGLSAADVQGAILQSAAHYKWEIREKTDGRIVCHYAHRANEATLTIKYDTMQVAIYAIGRARRGGLPVDWIQRLEKQINLLLGQAAALRR